MDTTPKWLTEKHKKILVVFKRMGGRGHISDVRRAANVTAGDALAKKLIANGLMQNTGLTLSFDGRRIRNGKSID